MAAIPFTFARPADQTAALRRNALPAGEPHFFATAGAARRLAADAANGAPLQPAELSVLFCRKVEPGPR